MRLGGGLSSLNWVCCRMRDTLMLLLLRGGGLGMYNEVDEAPAREASSPPPFAPRRRSGTRTIQPNKMLITTTIVNANQLHWTPLSFSDKLDAALRRRGKLLRQYSDSQWNKYCRGRRKRFANTLNLKCWIFYTGKWLCYLNQIFVNKQARISGDDFTRYSSIV